MIFRCRHKHTLKLHKDGKIYVQCQDCGWCSKGVTIESK
jgi:hypothetical protein